MPLFHHTCVLAILLMSSSVHAHQLKLQQRLGQKLFQDLNLSLNRNQSCETCHTLSRVKVPTEVRPGVFKFRKQPAFGFVDATNVQNGTSVADGSVDRAFGQLNPPSVGYAAFSPSFHFDPVEGLFFGGQFWNGRSSDLVEQAKQPFLNPVEMAMPSEWAVIQRLQENNQYVKLFKALFHINLKDINAEDVAVSQVYTAMAISIAEFERSRVFNRFDSKFDFEAAGVTQYNASEQRGADLFDAEGKCGLCHVTDGIEGEGTPSLLTDFSYDNLGAPANPQIPGTPSADIGLQGNPNLDAARGEPSPIEEVQGRHKVMSLRNIELTAPYMHNGVFKTLEEVVHFYNTRDVLPICRKPADAGNPGFGVTCWPLGEFHATRNTEELGDLGLTAEDEADIVSYLKTFTDNYPLWGNRFGLHDPNVPKHMPSPFAANPIPELPETNF